jgi:unsaturated rhamnogalacturonyl hydrolase
MVSTLLVIALLGAAPSIDADLRAIAALPGEPSIIAAAGLTKDDTAILSIENAGAFDPASTKRRAVVVGTTATTAAAVIGMVRWFKTDEAAAALRDQWMLSALPLADFDPSDTKSTAMSRWMRFQAADVFIEVTDGDTHPVGPGDVDVMNWVMRLPAPSEAVGSTLRAAKPGHSALRDTILARVRRDPLAIARLLAARYPETPSISYIPSVAWVNTLKLAAITGDQTLAQKVRDQTSPWVKGEQPLFGNRIQLTSVAGTMIFADLGGDALPRAFEGAKLAAARKADGIAEYGQGWTDDMFMAAAVLARVGRMPDHGGDLELLARFIVDYAGRLQRPDGVFIHATDGPFAWGRGNGFAALGLMETLTALPDRHPMREPILAIYRRQMTAMKTQQSPDGMWREVIDEPGAYREETATAMLMTAMARGIRLGWIDASFTPVVDRAWRGLAAHVKEDGTIVDVCTGTGAGPTKRYYLDRAAITGADDRGGALALFASMEMMALKTR